MKKAQDVYVLHNYVYWIHFTVSLTHVLANIAYFYLFHQNNSCIGFIILKHI